MPSALIESADFDTMRVAGMKATTEAKTEATITDLNIFI